MAHLIDEKLVWICHKCKFTTFNRFNLYSSDIIFRAAPSMSISSLKVFCVKMVLFSIQNFCRAFDFHSPLFCIIPNCSFKFVASKALKLKSFRKKNICFLKVSFFFFFFILLTYKVQMLTVAAGMISKTDFPSNAGSSVIVLWELILQGYSCICAEFPVKQNCVLFWAARQFNMQILE